VTALASFVPTKRKCFELVVTIVTQQNTYPYKAQKEWRGFVILAYLRAFTRRTDYHFNITPYSMALARIIDGAPTGEDQSKLCVEIPSIDRKEIKVCRVLFYLMKVFFDEN
jgi:hypothetical protein